MYNNQKSNRINGQRKPKGNYKSDRSHVVL